MTIFEQMFEQKKQIAENLLKRSCEQTSEAKMLLSEFYVAIETHPFIKNSVRILPTTIQAYTNILLGLSDTDLQTSLDFMLKNYNKCIIEHHSLFTQAFTNHDRVAKCFFDTIYNKFITLKQNDIIAKFMPILFSNNIWIKETKNTHYFLDRLFVLPEPLLNEFSKNIYKLYATTSIPTIRNKIFNFIIKQDHSTDQLEILFYNLAEMIKQDISIANNCLNLVEKHLNSPFLNTTIISKIIDLVGHLTTTPEFAERSKYILKQIIEHKSLVTSDSFRVAARKLGNTEELRSTIRYGKCVTDTDNKNWQDVDQIPVEKPCVLIFGGARTNSEKSANGYMKSIASLLHKHNVEVDIYSVVYDFGDRNQDKSFAFYDPIARKQLLYQKGHRLENKPISSSIDDIDPRYVHQLFETIFLPRISKNGVKIDVSDAIKNIRNITIFAHCHGGYTFLKLEELMQQKMIELGYTPNECATIQKQLLCVSHAPYCPLGISKSTFISFSSIQDDTLHHFNNFDRYVRTIVKSDGIRLSYFPDKLGNIFLVSQIFNEPDYEHASPIYAPDKITLTPEGQILKNFEQNTIVNGVKSSILQTTIPSTEQLVTNGDETLTKQFKQAVTNGNTAYLQLVTIARKSKKSNE